MNVIPINKYCEETGDTPAAINKRLERGTWQRGVHVLKIEGTKERWIDKIKVEEWVRANSHVA